MRTIKYFLHQSIIDVAIRTPGGSWAHKATGIGGQIKCRPQGERIQSVCAAPSPRTPTIPHLCEKAAWLTLVWYFGSWACCTDILLSRNSENDFIWDNLLKCLSQNIFLSYEYKYRPCVPRSGRYPQQGRPGVWGGRCQQGPSSRSTSSQKPFSLLLCWFHSPIHLGWIFEFIF